MEYCSFPFHCLPVLVKFKILRQYIPFSFKTFVLSCVPEFCELLDCQSSWPNPSENFITLYRILRSLKPGLYWNLEQDANAGYYVSIDAKRIHFTLCSININAVNDFFDCNFSSELFENNSMCISLKTMQNFLTLFLKKYSTTNEIQVYKSNMGHHFYINFFTKKLHWGKKVYSIKNKKCVIRHSLTKTFIINLKQNDIIQLIHHNMERNSQYTSFNRRKEKIEPLSLKAYILRLQEKTVSNQRIIIKIGFEIMEDHVSLHVDTRPIFYTRVISIYNNTRGNFPLNGVGRLKHTFEELCELFVPLKSCPCVQSEQLK